jgi:hypothetical protein
MSIWFGTSHTIAPALKNKSSACVNAAVHNSLPHVQLPDRRSFPQGSVTRGKLLEPEGWGQWVGCDAALSIEVVEHLQDTDSFAKCLLGCLRYAFSFFSFMPYSGVWLCDDLPVNVALSHLPCQMLHPILQGMGQLRGVIYRAFVMGYVGHIDKERLCCRQMPGFAAVVGRIVHAHRRCAEC